MPENTEQVETVDNVAEARRALDHAGNAVGLKGEEECCANAAAIAQAHASLAIAEQLERLNETLGGLTGGGTDRYLKVRNG